MEALGNTSWPQEILYEILEMNIMEIDQEKQFGVWSYKLKFSWYDHRIKWPEECQIQGLIFNSVFLIFLTTYKKDVVCNKNEN